MWCSLNKKMRSFTSKDKHILHKMEGLHLRCSFNQFSLLWACNWALSYKTQLKKGLVLFLNHMLLNRFLNSVF